MVYILTNNHVVEDANEIKLTLSSGEEVDAEVLGTDKYMDIAVLRMDGDKVLQVAEIGDSTEAKLGDTIFTVGTPVSTDYAGTVTKVLFLEKIVKLQLLIMVLHI